MLPSASTARFEHRDPLARFVMRRAVMDVRDLEISLESALAVTWPSRRDVRDALVRYFVTLARPMVLQGMQAKLDEKAGGKGAKVEEAALRKQLNTRLAILWAGSSAQWEDPALDELIRFRERIESFASLRREDPELKRARQLLSDLFLATAVAERLRALRRRSHRQGLRLIQGGGEISAPRHTLRLVHTPVPTPKGPQLPEG